MAARQILSQSTRYTSLRAASQPNLGTSLKISLNTTKTPLVL
ncbi:hypothetical protein [Yersinia frederiksenii]|nr:hypothetical protein [Yersinia frederiksenii]